MCCRRHDRWRPCSTPAALPDDAVAQIEEQLSGACTTEIAAFDEFTRLLTDDALVVDFDHIALAGMPARLRELPAEHVPLRPMNIVGTAAVRALLADKPGVALAEMDELSADELPGSLSALVDEIAAAGRGLVMIMGKGGVGKTTIAAAVAVELACRGVAVHLSTTDRPHAHRDHYAAGDHARPRSGAVAGRSPAGRHRAMGLGHQPEPGCSGDDRSGAAGARRR
jgi:anion-transporting  ArsA/GET3 family ATPase